MRATLTFSFITEEQLQLNNVHGPGRRFGEKGDPKPGFEPTSSVYQPERLTAEPNRLTNEGHTDALREIIMIHYCLQQTRNTTLLFLRRLTCYALPAHLLFPPVVVDRSDLSHAVSSPEWCWQNGDGHQSLLDCVGRGRLFLKPNHRIIPPEMIYILG